jgi:hypothetical protein
MRTKSRRFILDISIQLLTDMLCMSDLTAPPERPFRIRWPAPHRRPPPAASTDWATPILLFSSNEKIKIPDEAACPAPEN